MKAPYFVMVYTKDKESAWPLEDEWTDVAFFETELEARDAGNADQTAVRFGFEVCKMGNIAR